MKKTIFLIFILSSLISTSQTKEETINWLNEKFEYYCYSVFGIYQISTQEKDGYGEFLTITKKQWDPLLEKYNFENYFFLPRVITSVEIEKKEILNVSRDIRIISESKSIYREEDRPVSEIKINLKSDHDEMSERIHRGILHLLERMGNEVNKNKNENEYFKNASDGFNNDDSQFNSAEVNSKKESRFRRTLKSVDNKTKTELGCDFKTTHRPDGVTIKYFNPKPVIFENNIEVGTSIYKNQNTGEFTLNITILFKNMRPVKLNGTLIVQTTSSEGLELPIVVSKLVKMNGRDTALGLYKINERDFDILNNYDLKSIYFHLNDEFIGSSVTKNKDVLKGQLDCFEKF